MGDTTRDLEEYRRESVRQRRSLWRERLSRRTVIRGSTLLTLGSSSSMAAFLAACSGSNSTPKRAATAYNPAITTPASAATGGAGAAAPAAASTFKDTTGTPPYTLGLSDADAKIDPI